MGEPREHEEGMGGVAGWARLLLGAVGYHLAARFSLTLIAQPESLATFWPPTGLLLGWLAWTPRRDWGRILPLVALAHFLAEFSFVSSPLMAGGYTLAAIIEATVSAWLYVSLVGQRPRLDSARAVIALVLVTALVGAPLGATLGAAINLAGGFQAGFWDMWSVWWIGESLGVVVVTPVWLTAADTRVWGRRARPAQMLEVAMLLGLSLAAGFVLFGTEPRQAPDLLPLMSLPLPIFLWAALRFGTPGVAWGGLGFSVIAVWETVHGHGLLSAAPGTMARHVLLLQAYLAIVSLSSLLLAAVAAERERMIGALHASESQFKQLMDVAPVSMVVTLPDRQTIYANPKTTTLFGYAAADVVTVDDWWCRAFPDPAYRERVKSEWSGRLSEAARRGTGIRPMEATVTCKDGTTRSIEFHTASIGERTVVAHFDLTEHKRAQLALQESDRRFRETLEQINLVAVGLDSEARITFCNEFMLNLTGWSREEVLGRSWFEVSAPGQPEVEEVFRKLMQRDTPAGFAAHIENEIVTRQGTSRLIRWSNTVLRGKQGEPTGTLSVGEDITDQRRAEEQLRQAQKMEAVGLLTGGIAHDFNNLLTVVLANTALVLTDLPPDLVDPRRALSEVEGAARRGSTMVRKLLAFSRQELLALRPLDLSHVVDDLTSTMRRVLPASIEIRFTPPEGLPRVIADAGAVEQMVLNLATNARDAMLGGGTLTLELGVSQLSGGDQLADPGRPGEYVTLSVRDTGTGMSKEIVSRIWEPFFTTKPPGHGTGLGLPMVFGLMKQHNGSVDLTSDPGQGTVVRLYFPVAKASVEARAVPARSGVGQGGMETLLVVEDDASLRNVVNRTLRRLGYTVLLAADGEEGLRVYKENLDRVSLIVSDAVMPRMGGLDLLDRLREEGHLVPFILTSGYSEREMPVGDKAVPVLQKPWSVEEFARKVREVLDQ